MSQIVIGDRRPGRDNLPEWDDDSNAKGIAVSAGAVCIATADRADFVFVDFRNDEPSSTEPTWFEGKMQLGAISAAPPDDVPASVLWLPGDTAWRVVITGDSAEQEDLRHVTVYLPELADARYPDGPWTRD
ncbi:hypothetical protein UK23_23770 [Lentzea aerocolonigenes]|uniref:Uncharacterized protein n=1 Tax=Lentzea aerocolonigenes TaxID=68170 RepID=A0A0F0GS59_LENAE|nr:hypothetical protein [Lentzea aerocolonigenes]KJK46339.1 hypothetical protein UK23_23770 [Lentzea aerocolonigenes]